MIVPELHIEKTQRVTLWLVDAAPPAPSEFLRSKMCLMNVKVESVSTEGALTSGMTSMAVDISETSLNSTSSLARIACNKWQAERAKLGVVTSLLAFFQIANHEESTG